MSTGARPLTPVDGVILYDKPAGVTSHDIVYRVRRELPRKTRVGHAGTLDPFATGLLLVLTGRGTRAQRFLMGLEKRYETIARFGATSTTGDSDGEVTETGVVPEGELTLPTGLVRQRPPAYSALRVDGERAYAKARRGEHVELPEREVMVHEFSEQWHDGARRGFAIRCSSGTYVRSLVADLGDAYCEQLRRTAIGPFDVADADPERIVPLGDVLAFLPERQLDDEEARRAGHGVAVPATGAEEGFTRLTDEHGLIAIAEPRLGEDGAPLLKPVVGLRG
ncbi:tRNA pseudouridine(55) synthase TruB [Conexibacter stalactiti]|uniref:tRNA pseudouridine synthase B n=1 Tax=Conexibacter stalactiti TaxID=1940611 RepID=A0ABU4HPW9_9ACTN|nr:tRNA pseudouridine(55) synthase TruB [Conexibacter stalactiti]MDW5595373.1 tRNA pseudouridine(55) synthase TruB [Conexibacter stalactiti]MEC5036015.1 tRNA pseudouridine(55) synthase TruB [Conexibacter stalactiti]